MAVKSAVLRLLLSSIDDTGYDPSKEADASLTLSGYTDITPGRRLTLAAGASDQALSFTEAVGLVIISHDNPFKLRIAAGETLLTNLRRFVLWCDDEDDGARATSVLLTGNGSTPADLEVWIIEKAS